MNRLVAVTVMTAVLSSGAEPYRELSRPHFSKTYPSRAVAPLDLGTGPLKLHIFVDRSSVELVFPKPESSGISLQVEGRDADDSIWKGAKE
jgi:hypothetical protein